MLPPGSSRQPATATAAQGVAARHDQDGEFGEAGAFALHLGEHLGELAQEDVGIGDELRAPTAEGDGFELGLEELEVARERPADLVVVEKFGRWV